MSPIRVVLAFLLTLFIGYQAVRIWQECRSRLPWEACYALVWR